MGTYVGEVGNTTTDEQDLAVGVHGCAQHEVEDGAGVVEGLRLSGRARVLTVAELALRVPLSRSDRLTYP